MSLARLHQADRASNGAPALGGGTGSRTEAPGVAELAEMCQNARTLARLCDRLEPLVDLRLPASFDRAIAIDEASDEDHEPYIWDFE